MSYNYRDERNFSGKPYSTTAISANPVRNNGGTVLMGGNIRAVVANQVTPVTNALGITYLGYHSGINGSIVPVSPSGFGATTAISGRKYAAMTAGVYIGFKWSNMTIAGTASTLLIGGAADFGRRAENLYVGYVRTAAFIMTGGWIYQTGQPIFRRDQTESIPNETVPTRAIPGKLAYIITGKTVKTDTYKAKTD